MTTRYLMLPTLLGAAAMSLLLAACGGGGGDSGASPAPAPASNLVLTGTVAGGAAVAGAAVEAKCATGNGSAVSATNGNFSITVAAGALPCVLRATAGALVFHSIAATSGASARANLTPVTELTVARFAGVLPSAYYAGFGVASAAALTDSAAQAAALSAIDILKSSVDFSGVGVGVLNGPLAAANGATAGDSHDQRLDALRTAMTAAGVSLAQLTQAVANASPAAPPATRSGIASLPAELLLVPVATNCASLRSGRYRVLVNADGGSAPITGIITVNAPALTLVNTSGDTESLVPTGTCTYTNADGGEVFVNKAGIAISRTVGAGTMRAAVMFPEQAHGLVELAGDYNSLAIEKTTTNNAVHLTSSATTFDGNGKMTARTFCDDLRTCLAANATGLATVTLTANAGGGFNVTNTAAGSTDRAFAYRAGGGELMLVQLANAGHITFMTRSVPVALPAVGRIQQFWNLFVSPTYFPTGPISQSKSTVVSVDVAANSYVRNQQMTLQSPVTRPETFQVNSLREGYFHRVGPVAAQQSDGTFSTVTEFISLPMRGMDLTVVVIPAVNQFGIASLEF